METPNYYGMITQYILRTLASQLKAENPFQRVIDNNKVDLIKKGLLEEKERVKSLEVIQTGVIHIGICQGSWYIIDGQHRFKSYCELNEPKTIWIQFWEFISLEEMRKKFIEINSNTAVENYVMNLPLGNNNKEAYDVLINYIQITYKHYLKDSDNPQYPNINITQIRKIMHLIEDLKNIDKNSIIAAFEQFNTKCLIELQKDPKESVRAKKTIDNNYKLYINRYISILWKSNAHKL